MFKKKHIENTIFSLFLIQEFEITNRPKNNSPIEFNFDEPSTITWCKNNLEQLVKQKKIDFNAKLKMKNICLGFNICTLK